MTPGLGLFGLGKPLFCIQYSSFSTQAPVMRQLVLRYLKQAEKV